MSEPKLRRRRKPAPSKPKLPISNIAGFPSGMSHADLRRKFPIFRASIAEHISVSTRKVMNAVKNFNELSFRVDYSNF